MQQHCLFPEMILPDPPRTAASSADKTPAVPTFPSGVTEVQRRIVDRTETLPPWPDLTRGIPNEIVRSEIFGMVRSGQRQWKVNEVIRSWRGCSILFTGEEFDQRDLDVWMAVLHLFRGKDLAHPIYATASDLLGVMDKSLGKKNYDALRESIRRLKKATVEIVNPPKHFAGGFVSSFEYDMQRKSYRISIDPGMAKLFALDYTRIEWSVRRGLKGDLTRWLHSYICSHRATSDEPSRIHLENIKELAGISAQRPLYKVRFDIKASMVELQRFGIVLSWEIQGDLLRFVRPPRGHFVQEMMG